jgi:DNA polymerase-3 subunit alpha
MILAGLIRSIRRRGGNRGSFVSIEDMTSQIEVAVSDETWARYADALTKDEIVVVDGTVSADSFSGGYRMAAQKIRTLAAARLEFARGVQISLRSCDSDACEALEAAFLPYRKGRARVFIDYSNNRARARLELGSDWSLSPCEELLAALSGLAAVSDACLVY